ncbi:hypothetical protein [Hyphomonas johnsonii]|uniref:Uncharacterized protein n=1 Tax=Hyphomonas johnsonii MHS-2 TaxID=1280950 RepID=A0A059FHI0_9PROT|nr:hypothetical protein [Hyphomonas johnsonii]KCZ90089.1 hypothetical protein HJO_14106 [Hyphomonas johnsonii MHS-2]
MTFDARKGSELPGSNNSLYAAVVVAVVGGAFFLALTVPLPGKATSPDKPRTDVIATLEPAAPPTPTLLSSKSAEKYFETLHRVDPAASRALQKRLIEGANLPASVQSQIAFEHAAELFKRRSGDLALADTRHVDDLLSMTRESLRSASRSRSAWCKGSQYAALDQASFTDGSKVIEELEMLEEPLRDFGYDVMTSLLVAIEDAEEHPVRHGALTPTDKAALQGVMMSMVSDPQVMPLLMAAQSGADTDAVMKSLNVCELGATAMTALKTLPQDTKGRVFADLVRQSGSNGVNLESLTRF